MKIIKDILSAVKWAMIIVSIIYVLSTLFIWGHLIIG